MKKLYFLKYGSATSKKEVSKLLDDKWDITCSEHDSSYFGVYFAYTGLYADKLIITDNYISHSNEWLEEDDKEFSTIIKVSFTNGKNPEKLSRYKFLKNAFNKLDGIFIICDECIEEE
ncbi:hypothetical protein [Serratia entomophila]|uniref:hypothetical protein n=1 Tax=Serratia entomophila TaxID=42906 RepID=UPI00217BC8BB|nr:hypothetical protein [Serratia entomophila]CAI0914998.1 Uncharacterised protein [Serratia entomophila]CAI1552703.1 Uncharacterised protein [Serratia entomophila]CAI1582616.1 Uncharacterised protein [Serratia entomophila]CAI1602149.1 Uncharacterised protein [Serratia entomophila]CAI1608454.1 Uncharacterised protein [Serratia entomophila]